MGDSTGFWNFRERRDAHASDDWSAPLPLRLFRVEYRLPNGRAGSIDIEAGSTQEIRREVSD
jgi:hypothetical protein